MLQDQRPLVFVTVGTDHHPFDRLVDWIDDWMIEGGRAGRARVFVQSGTARAPRHAAWAEMVPHREMQDHMGAAVAVVCHGGPATITECREAGVRPIVVPRRHDLGEHVDDHQVRFARHMAKQDKIHLADYSVRLGDLLDQAISEPGSFRFPPGKDGLDATVGEIERVVGTLLACQPSGEGRRGGFRALTGRRSA